jgi:hypothetical protein
VIRVHFVASLRIDALWARSGARAVGLKYWRQLHTQPYASKVQQIASFVSGARASAVAQ